MPVNVWCEGCHEHIARGVRYNAEKKKCGTYFSSDVFEFQMNCHLCGQRFIIKTDPQNRDYEFVSGLRRKVETFDVKDIGTREFDEKEQALMRTDAIRSLENKEEDALNFQKAVPALDGIKSIQDRLYQDEDSLNRTVRDKLRGMRKAEERRENRAKAAGLGIHLLPTSKSDIKASRSVLFHKKTKAEVDAKLREINAKTGSIFGESDPLRDHTIRQCIRNGVDLRLLKYYSVFVTNNRWKTEMEQSKCRNAADDAQQRVRLEFLFRVGENELIHRSLLLLPSSYRQLPAFHWL